MASQIVKNVCYTLTPGKCGSGLLNLLPSPHDIKKKALSAVSSKSFVFNANGFVSPEVELKTYSSLEDTKKKRYLPPQLFDGRSMIKNNKVSRCLFSPEKISRKSSCNVSLQRKKMILHEPAVLSFDTPHRVKISPSELIIKNHVLGRGSYGVVVRGKYKNNIVAVKIIKKKDFKKEGDIMKSEMNALKLHHPNIVKVFKVVTNSNMNFILMELCNKTNLENILRREIMTPLVKLKYLAQIGNALDYCHHRGILHLDVKPKNVIVNVMNTSCKLCDFGSSKKINDAEKPGHTIKGTLKYTAPELLRGQNPTEKADIYSYGITMWQTMYQEVPYSKEDIQTVVYKVVNQNYRPRSQVISHKMEGHYICEACWHAEPMQRPPMSRVMKMLEELKQNYYK